MPPKITKLDILLYLIFGSLIGSFVLLGLLSGGGR
jgi:hypothetical protein